jgi:hypothetical protein
MRSIFKCFAGTLGCAVLSCFALSQTAIAAETPLLFGSLQMPPKHFAVERQAGLKVAVIAANWGKCEPSPGIFDNKYIGELAAEKEQLRKFGYKLQLDLGVQYPPAWVLALPGARYRDQFGDSFVSTESGKDVPNLVFSGQVRGDLGAYIDQIFARLGNDWDFVRLGCAKYGELNYPETKFNGSTNCYWAFDDFAQGRTAGLPDGIEACPVPGWKPGSPSPNHADAKAFINWYLNSLKNYQEWQIARVRKSYAGDICMLYGSWGVRPEWLEQAVNRDLDGGSSCERNGELQQGYDWARMIGAITDPKVIVYCTWVDGTIGNRDIADDDSSDPTRWSPVHWQASLAQSNPLHLRIWGENTGQNNLQGMQITFERIKRFHLMGLLWAFDRELFAEPNPKAYATFTEYSQFIRSADSHLENQTP